MKKLNNVPMMKIFVNEIKEWLFKLIVFIFKPIVQFLYKRYRNLKRKNRNTYKVLYRNTFWVGIVCVLAIVIAFGAGQFVQDINAHNNEILHKYYTSITVQPGDSLWSIAEDHYSLGYDNPSDYIKEVMHINHLSEEDIITSGSILVIPYYSNEIK